MNTIMQLRKICNHPFIFPPIEDAFSKGPGPQEYVLVCLGVELSSALQFNNDINNNNTIVHIVFRVVYVRTLKQLGIFMLTGIKY